MYFPDTTRQRYTPLLRPHENPVTLKERLENEACMEFGQIVYIYKSEEDKYLLASSDKTLREVLNDLKSGYTALPF